MAPEELAEVFPQLDGIAIQWTADTQPGDLILIERASGEDFEMVVTLNHESRDYLDTDVSVDTAYRYRVKSENGAGYSGYSNILETVYQDYIPFIRGDANADGRVDIADAIFILSYLFGNGRVPDCMDAADSNDDGSVDIADAIFILKVLFVTGEDFPAPYPFPGRDPTEDSLNCSLYPRLPL